MGDKPGFPRWGPRPRTGCITSLLRFCRKGNRDSSVTYVDPFTVREQILPPLSQNTAIGMLFKHHERRSKSGAHGGAAASAERPNLAVLVAA